MKTMEALGTALLVNVLLFLLKSRRKQLTADSRRRRLIIMVGLILSRQALLTEWSTPRSAVRYPSPGVKTHGAESEFWTEDLFDDMFRFRRHHFLHMMDAMGLRNKSIFCGRRKKGQSFPADICLMVVLRRLAYPCRFNDLVNVFGIPSNRICDIFHSTLDYLFHRFAEKIQNITTWLPFFPDFCEAMSRYGSPYANLIGLLDGNFMQTCRPGGLGNKYFRLDQSELFTGEKCAHGLKFLAALFPNGMTVLCGPFKGKVHDGRMIFESGWLNGLEAVDLRGDGFYSLFGDAGFANDKYLQVMIKAYGGYIGEDAKAFNALMSRIRIHIENAFAGKSKVFNFLSYGNALQVGGRRVERAYMVATFLMNCRTTFYGNQFTHELDNPLRMTVEELLALADST
jgi:hypothetical protein